MLQLPVELDVKRISQPMCYVITSIVWHAQGTVRSADRKWFNQVLKQCTAMIAAGGNPHLDAKHEFDNVADFALAWLQWHPIQSDEWNDVVKSRTMSIINFRIARKIFEAGDNAKAQRKWIFLVLERITKEQLNEWIDECLVVVGEMYRRYRNAGYDYSVRPFNPRVDGARILATFDDYLDRLCQTTFIEFPPELEQTLLGCKSGRDTTIGSNCD